MCLLGDQGFTNGVQGLATAAERQAPVITVVCNNGSSVSLRKQARFDGFAIGQGMERILGNNHRMDYAAIARGYGIGASVLTWPEHGVSGQAIAAAADTLAETMAKAMSERRPHILELIVPGTSEFWAGVWNVSGHEELPVWEAVAGQDLALR